MLKYWFDATQATEFGTRLAETFSAKFPIADKKSVTKRAQVISKLISDVRQFKQTNRPNFYKKAKLANAFKWKLLEQGYDAEFVDELTKEVLLALK